MFTKFISFLSLTIIILSCNNETTEDVRESATTEDEIEITTESYTEISEVEEQTFEFEKFDQKFNFLDDSLYEIHANYYYNSDFVAIDSIEVLEIYQDDFKHEFKHYAEGKMILSKRYSAYLIGAEYYESSRIYIWIYDGISETFSKEEFQLAVSGGDAGEQWEQITWITDVDEDGFYEFLIRSGNTYLDIDHPEEERETNIADLELWEFDAFKGEFIKDTLTDISRYDQRFVIEF
ncbi:hypothetical protein K6119_02455 [Paracrocinitomix mangrovi]|uniref:hypothetical protein n=1 Tax=Paracrocinitomix mangrovi TaxID=2862509 RepID=UPI001C8E87AD|nr:hypothetical protein [Paracrocinitomix mangrovi]UKN02382.1 hypothetical protein K6119_02455 [Paracrocinitomix mangrovi]